MTESLFFTCEEIDLKPRVYCKFDMSYYYAIIIFVYKLPL